MYDILVNLSSQKVYFSSTFTANDHTPINHKHQKKIKMKKSFKFSLMLTLVSFIAFNTPLIAQDATKELEAFTKKFQSAYNAKDEKTLKTMYTDDAVRTASNGVSVTGSEAIVAQFKEFFTENEVKIELKQTSAEAQTDGSATATGTYQVTGTSKTGEKIDRSGTYVNTVVKQKKQWKIAKTVLTGN
jgi:uncharacterized protein (TIGR02246 family)